MQRRRLPSSLAWPAHHLSASTQGPRRPTQVMINAKQGNKMKTRGHFAHERACSSSASYCSCSRSSGVACARLCSSCCSTCTLLSHSALLAIALVMWLCSSSLLLAAARMLAYICMLLHTGWRNDRLLVVQNVWGAHAWGAMMLVQSRQKETWPRCSATVKSTEPACVWRSQARATPSSTVREAQPLWRQFTAEHGTGQPDRRRSCS